MGIVPKGRAKRISWYRTRVNSWAKDPESIGVTAEQVAAMAELV